MNTKKIFILLAVSIFAQSAWAKSPVWRVSKDDQLLFIGGTIHLLSEQDYPLPKAFDTAFALSEQLVFETDIENANSVATQAKFLPVLMYQDGRTLKSELQAETYESLQAFLADRNLPAAMFERFTPAGLNLTLLVLELQQLGINGNNGVESHLNVRAKKSKKSVQWLESLDQQVSFIARMNQLDADLVINSTIRDTGKIRQEWPKLLSAWRQGDMAKLENLAIKKMIDESPELYDFILADRNENWLPEIESMLATPEIEFVLVGALHLAGKDSVLTMLENKGFDVKQLD